MNKILNINLGGYALTIDDDAHVYLSSYLDSIRRRFSESEGRDEIIGDIETRLGELISQSMGTRTIVMLPDAEAAVAVMGKPEDFGGTEDSGSGSGSSNGGGSGAKKGGRSTVGTGKRLFRDEEDAVVAGVCSGLAAYFGIQDPVWVRLIFVIAFASFGFGVPAYFLLWILVPQAKSAADRLAMRGENINMDNIAREVEEGFERLSKKVNEFGSDAAKKGSSGASSALSTGVTALGQAFGLMLRFIAKFAALIAILIGIALFLGLGAGWIGSIVALMIGAPYVEYFSPFSSGWTWFGIANIFFLLGIPAIALVLYFSRILFKTSTPTWVKGSLTGLFILSVIAAFSMLPFGIKEYSQTGTVSKNIDLADLHTDTLRVEALPDLLGGRYHNSGNGFNFSEDGVRINENGLEMRCPLEIRIMPSHDGLYHCTQIIKSQGTNNLTAQENADRVGYNASFSNNKLQIPTAYTVAKGEKWRGQRVRINIEVPTGKNISFDEAIHEYAGADLDEYDDENDNNYISRRPGKIFRMGTRGLVCADCPNMGDKGYRSDRNYENFILEGDFATEIRQGDDFRVEIVGPNEEKSKVQKIQTGDKITFTTNGKSTNGSVHIMIQTPSFTSLHADNTGEIIIRGFDEGTASITASGRSHIKAYMDVSSEFSLALSGKASVDLTGKGNELKASLTDNSVLESSNWSAERVEISSSDNAKARVFAKDDALILSTGQSSVRVDGGAHVRNKRDDE